MTSPALETDSLPFYIRPRVFEDTENFRVTTKLHTDLLQDSLGILLDDLRPLVTEHVEHTNFALNVRYPRRGNRGRRAVGFFPGGPSAILRSCVT